MQRCLSWRYAKMPSTQFQFNVVLATSTDVWWKKWSCKNHCIIYVLERLILKALSTLVIILLLEGRTHTANYLYYILQEKRSLPKTWYVLFHQIMANIRPCLFLSLLWLPGSSESYFMAHYSNTLTREVDIWLLNPVWAHFSSVFPLSPSICFSPSTCFSIS